MGDVWARVSPHYLWFLEPTGPHFQDLWQGMLLPEPPSSLYDESSKKGLQGGGVGRADENEARRRRAGHIPTVQFQNTRVGGEPERGFHGKAQISGSSGKSAKIEPPFHLLQSDSTCTGEGFSG